VAVSYPGTPVGVSPRSVVGKHPLLALTASRARLDYSELTLTILFVVGVLGFFILGCCAWMTAVQLIRSFSE